VRTWKRPPQPSWPRQALGEQMAGKTVRMAQKAGVDGRLFGSVTNADIADALTKMGMAVQKSQVRMPTGPIKTVGEHTVSVAPHTDVVVDVTCRWWPRPTERRKLTPCARRPALPAFGFVARVVQRSTHRMSTRLPTARASLMSAIFDPRESDARDDEVARLRVPPHSVEAEQSVLGGLLLDNLAWDRAAELLTDSDFYRYEHRLIYGAVAALVQNSRPADVITVFEQLQSQGKADDCGGLAYLNALAQSVPSAANMRRYAEIVRERAILRKLIAASDEIATAPSTAKGRQVPQILDEAEGKILKIGEEGSRQRQGFLSMDKLVGGAAGPRERTGRKRRRGRDRRAHRLLRPGPHDRRACRRAT
jgi:hypothetical protein